MIQSPHTNLNLMNFRPVKGHVKSSFLTSSSNRLIFSKGLTTQNVSDYLNHKGPIILQKLVCLLVQNLQETTTRGLDPAVTVTSF